MELENNKYILYVSYDRNKNLIDFFKNIKININNYDDNIENLIKIHYVIFDENNYDKMERYRNLISKYIENLTKIIINNTKFHSILKNSYVMDYIRMEMIDYEKNIKNI